MTRSGKPRSTHIRCRGHANVRGTHSKTLELSTDTDLTQRGTCILGVDAVYEPSQLTRLRGPLRIELQVGDLSDELYAVANPRYTVDDPLIIRRSGRLQGRTFAYGATKGAFDIRRDLIEALTKPGAELLVRVEEAPDEDERRVGGLLYVVSTPIGNPDDLSVRARRILMSVDRVAAEDTRVTRALLRELGIDKPLVSYHDQNERGRVAPLLAALERGERVALVSDAGTPGLSDPGFQLVSKVASRDITISPVPGPSAILAALVASGLPMAQFAFVGFLPRTNQTRLQRLHELGALPMSVVLFESPRRVLDCLKDIAAVYGERPICVARELTKTNEELLRGPAADILDTLTERQRVLGEFVIVLPGFSSSHDTGDGAEESDETPQWLDELTRSLLEGGVDPRSIRKAIQATFGWSRRRARDRIELLKDTLRKETDD